MIKTIDMAEATGEEASYKWLVELLAVSPSEAGEKELSRAYESSGIEDQEKTPLTDVSMLVEYGVAAHLWNDGGNNLKKLIKEAHKQADISSFFFGFMMDKPENAIGSNGWDFIKGDIDGGLRRWREEQDKKEEIKENE